MDTDVSSPPYDLRGDGLADDTAALQAALAAFPPSGGVLALPAGTYRTTQTIVVPPNVTIRGCGQFATVIVADHAGSALATRSPVNGSTAVTVRVESLGIRCARPDSAGAGFEDNGGTYLSLFDLAIVGFKWGVIFDQTECAEIIKCNIAGQLPGGASVWLTNGDTRTAGADGGYTNRLTIARNQINCTPGAYGIIDEGGMAHSFEGNNFNGGEAALYMAGVQAGEVRCCEFEGGASGYHVVLEFHAFYPSLATGERAGTGHCTAVGFQHNLFAGTAASVAAIRCVSAGGLTLIGNLIGGTNPVVDTLSECPTFFAAANYSGAKDPFPGRLAGRNQWIADDQPKAAGGAKGLDALVPTPDADVAPNSFFVGADGSPRFKDARGKVVGLGVSISVPPVTAPVVTDTLRAKDLVLTGSIDFGDGRKWGPEGLFMDKDHYWTPDGLYAGMLKWKGCGTLLGGPGEALRYVGWLERPPGSGNRRQDWVVPPLRGNK